MPAQVKKSGLMGRLSPGAKKAFEESKNRDINWGMQDLPPGINGGTAQLVSVKWDDHPADHKFAGKPYAVIRGSAKRPLEHQGVDIVGRSVMLMYPLYATDRKTHEGLEGTEDNWIMCLENDLSKIMGKDLMRKMRDVEQALEIGGKMAEDKNKPIYFRFSTRGWTPKPTAENPKPNEMVFVSFGERCEAPADVKSRYQTDNSGSTNGKAAGRPSDEPVVQEESEEPFNEFQDQSDDQGGDDLDELAAAADKGDMAAAKQLRVRAIEAGVPAKKVDADTTTWGMVVEMIRSATRPDEPGGDDVVSDGDDESVVDDDDSPKVGDVFKWKMPATDAKGKKVLKTIEVEVVTVDADAQTVTVKNADTKAAIKTKNGPLNIKWDALEGRK